jgi:hypothetical protein
MKQRDGPDGVRLLDTRTVGDGLAYLAYELVRAA